MIPNSYFDQFKIALGQISFGENKKCDFETLDLEIQDIEFLTSHQEKIQNFVQIL